MRGKSYPSEAVDSPQYYPGVKRHIRRLTPNKAGLDNRSDIELRVRRLQILIRVVINSALDLGNLI